MEGSETRVLMKTELLKEKIKSLTKEDGDLKAEVEKLQRNSKKNSILMFGL